MNAQTTPIEERVKDVFDAASGLNCAIDDGQMPDSREGGVHDIELAISHLQDALEKLRKRGF